MRKESYLLKPPSVEIYPVTTGTDMILRRNIELVEKEEDRDGESTKYECYECEEVQYRYKGSVTQEEVQDKFDYWWAIAEGKSEIEALDTEAVVQNEPTVAERLEALENGLMELAEVIING